MPRPMRFSKNAYDRACQIPGAGAIMDLTQCDIYGHQESTSFLLTLLFCCLNPQGQNKDPWLASESTVTALFISDNMWFLLLSMGKYTENSDAISFQDRKCYSRHSWGDGSSHVGPGDISHPLSSS